MASAMIFAAGFGTRMGALGLDRPKALIPLAGRPLLDHALDIARAEADRIVVNTHYRADKVHDHLNGTDVLISHEAEPILETGGGLRAARPLLGSDPVFTLNPDAAWRGPNPLGVLRAAWRGDMEALLLLVTQDQAVGHKRSGDFALGADGRLIRGGALTFTGAQRLRTDRLDAVEAQAFSLNLLWDLMAADGGLYGVIYPGRWCDVGYPEAIPLAEAMLRDG